jgi:hypothetical protein
MSQSGWPPPRIGNTVAPQQTQSAAIEKHAYVPALRVQTDYTAEQKEMLRTYNSMRVKLVEAGLMEDKP